MGFASRVERWRNACRSAAARYAAIDESDLLALINHESGGDPTAVSPTGYRGLGQVGTAALTDYNSANPSRKHTWNEMKAADGGEKQIDVVAWLVARGRSVVKTWGLPDGDENAAKWADARYSWGGGNLKNAIADYQSTRGSRPTFDQLAAYLPDAGKPNVKPWYHARAVFARAQQDRDTGGPALTPFPEAAPWLTAPRIAAIVVVLVVLAVAIVLVLRKGKK